MDNKTNAENIFKVRYIGIGTPESGDNYFEESTSANKALVEGKTLRLEKDVSETDKYGRLLRYVYVRDIFVNSQLVSEGFAFVYTYPPDVKYSDYFLELQHQTRNAGKGLWGLELAAESPQQNQTILIYVSSRFFIIVFILESLKFPK